MLTKKYMYVDVYGFPCIDAMNLWRYTEKFYYDEMDIKSGLVRGVLYKDPKIVANPEGKQVETVIVYKDREQPKINLEVSRINPIILWSTSRKPEPVAIVSDDKTPKGEQPNQQFFYQYPAQYYNYPPGSYPYNQQQGYQGMPYQGIQPGQGEGILHKPISDLDPTKNSEGGGPQRKEPQPDVRKPEGIKIVSNQPSAQTQPQSNNINPGAGQTYHQPNNPAQVQMKPPIAQISKPEYIQQVNNQPYSSGHANRGLPAYGVGMPQPVQETTEVQLMPKRDDLYESKRPSMKNSINNHSDISSTSDGLGYFDEEPSADFQVDPTKKYRPANPDMKKLRQQDGHQEIYPKLVEGAPKKIFRNVVQQPREPYNANKVNGITVQDASQDIPQNNEDSVEESDDRDSSQKSLDKPKDNTNAAVIDHPQSINLANPVNSVPSQPQSTTYNDPKLTVPHQGDTSPISHIKPAGNTPNTHQPELAHIHNPTSTPAQPPVYHTKATPEYQSNDPVHTPASIQNQSQPPVPIKPQIDPSANNLQEPYKPKEAVAQPITVNPVNTKDPEGIKNPSQTQATHNYPQALNPEALYAGENKPLQKTTTENLSKEKGSEIWDKIQPVDQEARAGGDQAKPKETEPKPSLNKYDRLENPAIQKNYKESPSEMKPQKEHVHQPQPEKILGKNPIKLDSNAVLKKATPQPQSQPEVNSKHLNLAGNVKMPTPAQNSADGGKQAGTHPIDHSKGEYSEDSGKQSGESISGNQLNAPRDRYKRKQRQQDLLQHKVQNADKSILGGEDIIEMATNEDFDNEFLKRKRKELLK